MFHIVGKTKPIYQLARYKNLKNQFYFLDKLMSNLFDKPLYIIKMETCNQS